MDFYSDLYYMTNDDRLKSDPASLFLTVYEAYANKEKLNKILVWFPNNFRLKLWKRQTLSDIYLKNERQKVKVSSLLKLNAGSDSVLHV